MPTATSPCDWGAVRRAFPLDVITLDDLVLRPLVDADLEPLCTFMTGDPEMTWPRIAWSRSNVAYLLNLRLAHYDKFGFGPYAVEREGRLIGMAGVQVWEEADCSIELLAYVEKQSWALGLGGKLLAWIIGALRASPDIHEVFAATRAENERAIRLARRMGFEEIGRGEHFGYPSIKWRLAL